jgi:hypothetical protein
MSRHSLKLLIAALCFGFAARGAQAANVGDPSYVGLKVYEMRVSANSDCSNSIRVFSNASPSYQDFTQTPDVGAGAVPNGTYPCVMLKMSDQLNVTPGFNSDGGNCLTTSPFTLDIARGDPTQDPVTGTQTATAVGEDIVWLYLSTTGGDADAPWIPSNALRLVSPFVVTAERTGTFVTNFAGQVVDNGSMCDCNPPEFTFR